jgi:hypothetical protein
METRDSADCVQSPRRPDFDEAATTIAPTPITSTPVYKNKKSVRFTTDTLVSRENTVALSIARHIFVKELGFTQYHIQVSFPHLLHCMHCTYSFKSTHLPTQSMTGAVQGHRVDCAPAIPRFRGIQQAITDRVLWLCGLTDTAKEALV